MLQKRLLLISIMQYVVLFIKKQYRFQLSKKLRFFTDEFTYLHPNLCRMLSICFTFVEVFVKCVFPLTIFLYPLVLKYVLLFVLFGSYLYKVREIRILPVRTWVHKVFVKDAWFELNGIIMVFINLLILLDIKVLVILLLLFILQMLNNTYVKNFLGVFLLLLYLAMFISPILYFQRSYLSGCIMIVGFFAVCFALYFSVRQNGKRIAEIKRTNRSRFLLYVDIQRLSRRLVENKITFIRFIFPPYILLYVFVFWVLDMFPSFFFQFSIDKDMLYSISLVLYIGIYFIYTKSSILLLDDCFYFTATKIELYVTNLFSNYFRKIVVLFYLNLFNIFWGMCYLNLVLKMNLAMTGLLFFLHLFMLPLFVSANIFVDKNKTEVTKYPEDFKKYASFIEAFFVVILFFAVNLFVVMHFDPRTASLNKSFLFDLNVYLISTLVFTGGTISILKILIHMGIVRKSIKKGFEK